MAATDALVDALFLLTAPRASPDYGLIMTKQIFAVCSLFTAFKKPTRLDEILGYRRSKTDTRFII